MSLTRRTPAPITKGPNCLMCRAIQAHNLDTDDEALLDEWFGDPRVTDKQIIEWLEQDNIRGVTASSLARHRRRECQARSHAV